MEAQGGWGPGGSGGVPGDQGMEAQGMGIRGTAVETPGAVDGGSRGMGAGGRVGSSGTRERRLRGDGGRGCREEWGLHRMPDKGH